jgi:hypothetical protein
MGSRTRTDMRMTGSRDCGYDMRDRQLPRLLCDGRKQALCI